MSARPDVRVIDAEPQGADVIERLEETLERARKGELSSIAIAVVYRDGTSGLCWSNAPSLSCLIGAIARLQYSMIQHAEEGS